MSGKGSVRKADNNLIDSLLAETRGSGAEVFFSHFRIGSDDTGYCGYATTALAATYVSPTPIGGVYSSVKEDKGLLAHDVIRAGWCFCSPKDQFRASRGRLGAVRRLISKQARICTMKVTTLLKRDVKLFAESLLHEILENNPPPWYSSACVEMPVERICLCGPKRAKHLIKLEPRLDGINPQGRR